jgi:tetratricopeptide (TPR) repeat protein
VLDIEAGLYDGAAQRLEKALNRNPSDGLSWYFLGVSQLNRKNENEALRCAYQAAKCFGTASLGFNLAGRSFMRLKEYSKAVEAFEKSVRSNPRDIKARNHLLLALYAAGESKLVYKYTRLRISQNPTDLVLRALAALESKKEMNRFVQESRSFVGEDEFEMLETSLFFADVGLVNEAAKILQSACVETVPQSERSPLPLYYLAYFSSLNEDRTSSMAYLREAAATNRDYIFPSRPEEVEILRYAIRENPLDAYANLHLGNLYANLGRLDEAALHWRKAGELNHSLSIAFRNLGLYAWAIENNLQEAQNLYAKAIVARPKDQTLYRDLADIFLADNKRPKAIEVLESAPFEKVRRADVAIMLAQAYLDEQRFTDAINLLESTPYFVNWEGQTIVWDIFNKAHLERGQKRFESKDFRGALQDFEAALTYPENIGVGRSNKPREAPAQYWRGKALEALGQPEQARSAWKEGADSPESSEEQNKYRELCKKAILKID